MLQSMCSRLVLCQVVHLDGTDLRARCIPATRQGTPCTSHPSRLSSFCSVLEACHALNSASTRASIETCDTNVTDFTSPVSVAMVHTLSITKIPTKCTHFQNLPLMLLVYA